MVEEVIAELEAGIVKAQEALRRDLAKLRTGRAHPSMLDSLRADYYGTSTPLSQIANISVPEPRMLTVKPWDKSAIQAVDKAIRESDLGLNPQSDGDLIRVPIPALSEERRRDLVKIAKRTGEDCKIAVRKVRHEAIAMLNDLKKEGDLSEDDVERGKKRVEDVVGTAGQAVDSVIQTKEKEILQV
jgi:ribosome recycling factor